MKETRILLASVLKPINDARMFRKLGLSLAKLPHTEVHVAGYQAPIPVAPANLHFYPLYRFKRLGLGRVLASWHYLKLLFRIKPQVIIVGTHELLLASVVYKLCRPTKLIYDVRENYYLNLSTQQIYAPWLSRFLARVIRRSETWAAHFVSAFFLAEKSYLAELPFLHQPYLVLENKYQSPNLTFDPATTLPTRQIPPDNIRLLYSGTISELYGVFEAVNLLNQLNQVVPVFRLTIIGYCSQTKVLDQLKASISRNSSVTLIGGDQLVPHPQIIQAIQNSHVGLLPYQPHPSTRNCIPTKLYEYLANGLPVLIQQNPAWESLVNAYQAGLALDYRNVAARPLYQQLKSRTFYGGKNAEPLYWQAEEEKLLLWARTNGLNFRKIPDYSENNF